ncbi:MAG: energy-coupling factor transporter transmembrane protein EcfT [Eubacterium sp.]|jgi:energy-coupling factor transport system permease protein|nr:energy-coupling factor transporter transmembrane protein EcfT [Eubacterium sp.]
MNLKDITIGQYFPGDSVIHRMDGRFKLVLSFLFIILLFLADNFIALTAPCVFVIMAYAVSEVSFVFIIKNIKPILPILIFTSILNLFFIEGNTVLLDLGFAVIYFEAAYTCVFVIVRIIALITGMSLVTYTTSPIMLTDAIESLLSPLKRVKFPVHELAMMMTIALRFIPTLIEETDRIMSAQKARGANLDVGGLTKRAKALIPVLIPLFISAFKRASELAVAMECRCYRGGEGRTKMKQLKSGRIDYFVSLLLFFVFGLVILNNIVF